jgi:hypothetical protein
LIWDNKKLHGIANFNNITSCLAVRSNSESEKTGSDPHHWQQVCSDTLPPSFSSGILSTGMPIAYLPLAAEYLAADSAANLDQFYTYPDLVFHIHIAPDPDPTVRYALKAQCILPLRH